MTRLYQFKLTTPPQVQVWTPTVDYRKRYPKWWNKFDEGRRLFRTCRQEQINALLALHSLEVNIARANPIGAARMMEEHVWIVTRASDHEWSEHNAVIPRDASIHYWIAAVRTFG